MISSAHMLVPAAERAGMEVPESAGEDEFQLSSIKETHPHFFVFCLVQLGRAVTYHGEHWENAKVIQEVPKEQLVKITLHELKEKGLHHP